MDTVLINLPSIEDGRRQRLDFLKNPDEKVINDFQKRITFFEKCTDVNSAWLYAKEMDYQHEGLGKLAYLAHPIRVANLYLDLVTVPNPDGVKLSLLHNLIEVTGQSITEIESEVGSQVAKYIELLTVDRKRQWNEGYKENYYEAISNAPLEVQQVKVLDKLDNLYMLSLNKSDDIRERYLKEIEKWVLPLSDKSLPFLYSYVKDLVSFNRKIGHSSE